MDVVLEECVADDIGVYGALSDDYDCAADAAEKIEDAELSAIISADAEDDEILACMGIDLDNNTEED